MRKQEAGHNNKHKNTSLEPKRLKPNSGNGGFVFGSLGPQLVLFQTRYKNKNTHFTTQLYKKIANPYKTHTISKQKHEIHKHLYNTYKTDKLTKIQRKLTHIRHNLNQRATP